ncbi:RNA-binding protein 39 isoform X4 [Vespula squamosa]|uniref:RNA-binding protein 39 isoform X4 n=1 Tax=Vespula squamosa TaxID=30214 RepID=A0ABD2A4C2_VESSQ
MVANQITISADDALLENSPTRAMAEELDVEAMLEAPYRKGKKKDVWLAIGSLRPRHAQPKIAMLS